MANVIELLRDGITKQDWESVKTAFGLLAGDTNVNTVGASAPKAASESSNRSAVVSAASNRFVDDGTLEKKYIEDSIRESEKFKGKEYRQQVKLIKVECSICHKIETVNEFFVRRRIEGEEVLYKCNKCCCVGEHR